MDKLTEEVRNFPDGRTLRRKYPWENLENVNDYFYWDNIGDAKSIRSAAISRGIKVSCKCNGEKLLVLRVE